MAHEAFNTKATVQNSSNPSISALNTSSVVTKTWQNITSIIRDAQDVLIESFKFTYEAGPQATTMRIAFSMAQSLQFLAYGLLTKSIAEGIHKASSAYEPTILLPIIAVFAFKGTLDLLQSRSQNSESIQQSNVEVLVQERIRDISPQSLERLNHPAINRDYKLVCLGGIWGLTGTSTEIIKAAGTVTSMTIAIVFAATHIPWFCAAVMASAVLYPLYKSYKLSGLVNSHEQEIAQKKAQAAESAWSRVWPNTARLYRILGIQSKIDNMVAEKRSEILKTEEALVAIKNRYSDIGHGLAAVGGTFAFLSIVSQVKNGSLGIETGLFVGISLMPMFYSSFDSLTMGMIALVKGKPVLDAMSRLEIAKTDECRGQGDSKIDWSNKGASIKLINLHFAYPAKQENARVVPILKDVSLEIEPGTFLSIVGDNGAGKSTLMQLLDRSYRATAGDVTVNDIAVTKVSDSNLFYGLKCLPQQVQQIDGSTLKDFLSFGRERSGVEQDYVLLERILSHLGVDQMLNEEVEALDGGKIKKFPEGLNTKMGAQDGGVTLSGGELSFLYAAYMLYSHAQVLCFDEPEKAISQERQKKLFDCLINIESLIGYRPTILLVTHSLERAIATDKLLFVEKGSSGIGGFGTHQELLESCPNYGAWYQRSVK
jgi:ABC-type multidrug transport system fused ATPase/permease subunit